MDETVILNHDSDTAKEEVMIEWQVHFTCFALLLVHSFSHSDPWNFETVIAIKCWEYPL